MMGMRVIGNERSYCNDNYNLIGLDCGSADETMKQPIKDDEDEID